VLKDPKFSADVYIITGQSGPRTALKCRIKGTMPPDRLVSMITAAFLLELTFAVIYWSLYSSPKFWLE
jgi:hypothetical protein